MNDISQKLLNRLYQDCRVGELGSEEVLQKCKDTNFKEIITNQLEQYKSISKECEELAKSFNINIADNGPFKKFKQIAMINMSLLFKCNDRRIAEMMITGTVMGVIDSIKALYDCDKADERIIAVGKKLQAMQEKYVNALKKYLEG